MLREWTDRLPQDQAVGIWRRQEQREVSRRVDRLDCALRATLDEEGHELVATFEAIRAFVTLRRSLFPKLSSDPAFDILLTLASTPARSEKASVTGLAYGAGVPLATAIRYLAALELDGIVKRTTHPFDGRKTLIELTDEGRRRLAALADSWMARALVLLVAPLSLLALAMTFNIL